MYVKKLLNKSAAIMLALIMLFAQMLTVLAGSEKEPNFSEVSSKSKIISVIRKNIDSDRETKGAGELLTYRSASMTEQNQELKDDSDLTNSRKADKSGIVPNQIIVKYKSGTSSMVKNAVNAKVSAVSSIAFNKLGITQLRLPKDIDIDSAMDKLKEDPNVEYVEPVYIRSAFGSAETQCNDLFYTKGWQWGLEAINMDKMWEAVPAEERSRVTIAVIDTGVDIDNDEFDGILVEGYDFVNNDNDADDDNGHGTHVAGIAAAAHDNEGIAGVAGGAKIMPVKVLDDSGDGDTAKVINGILFAVNNGADIINLSLGSYRYSRAEEEAVQYALDKGVTVIAAAGNEYGDDVNYPAAYDGVIAVGAADWDGENGEFVVAEFSSVGPELDILAPGVDILSIMPEELDNLKNRLWTGMGDVKADGYTVASGTSMAAPFVAGMAALLLAENPDMECSEVLAELLSKSVDLDISYEGEDIDVPLLNGDSAINPPFSFRRAVLSSASDSGTIELDLSFEDQKGVVADAVYGEFDLLMGEYDYQDGFSWISEPEAIEVIDVVNGEGSISVETDKDKNYLFYVDSTDDYLHSEPIQTVWDENEDFEEAQELELDTETEGSSGKRYDRDYYEFTVMEAGYYVIESTGETSVDGTLYDEFLEEIAWGSEIDPDMNFRIDTDIEGEPLFLMPGTYYVCVKGFEPGNYGIIVYKQQTISGTISLPDGITIEDDIYLEITLYEREMDAEHGEYEYKYKRWTEVQIQYGQNHAYYQILAEDGSDYIVQYYNGDLYNGYIITGYYSSIDGTVPLADEATTVAAGAEDINLTLIPISDVNADGMDTFGEAVPMQLGAAETGVMDYDGDSDYFELSIEEEGNYIIGTEMDINHEAYMYNGSLYNSSGEYVASLGSVSGIYEGMYVKYRIYNLTPGTYYYRATGLIDPFNSFEYMVKAEKASVISGRVSLPEGITAPESSTVLVIAEDSRGNIYIYEDRILRHENYFEYVLGVRPSNEYIVSYYIDEYEDYIRAYAQEGYYSTEGTKEEASCATKVNANNDISGIDLELIPLTDKEGDIKETAKQISTDVLVEGRIDAADDVDYYKFTVPEGGGYYNIDFLSQFDISIYIYDNDEWILYDQGYEAYMQSFLSEGINYLMVRAEDDDFGSYSFIVSGIHKPLAKDVSISGAVRVGSTLTGRYTYYDGDSDAEAGTTFRWLRSDTANGTYSEIAGATSDRYQLTQNDLGKYIKFEVTPKTNNEPAIGEAVISSAVGPVASASSSSGNRRSGGGGSGGGGSNESNNSYFEHTNAGLASITIGADGRTAVEITVDQSRMERALVSAGDKAVILDVITKAKQDNLQLNIPSSLFSKAAKAQKPVIVHSNNASFDIEPGTFDGGSLNGLVELTVSQLSADSVKGILKNKDAAASEVSLVYDLELSIGGNKVITFNKPIAVTVRFDASKATDLSKVGIYYYDEEGGRWKYVGGKVNAGGTITFKAEHFSKYTAMEYKRTFADINGHWAKSDIELLVAKHIARSVSEASFAPDSNITRAEFASMLVKALDIKGVSTDKVFTDVPSAAWYKDDVYKAYATGIVDGVGGSNFAPDAHITREQMATMLMRAYEYASGIDLGEIVTTMVVRFNDESGISSWARRNVILANALGLITGNPDGSYNAKGNTTKAHAATVIKRMLVKLNRL